MVDPFFKESVFRNGAAGRAAAFQIVSKTSSKLMAVFVAFVCWLARKFCSIRWTVLFVTLVVYALGIPFLLLIFMRVTALGFIELSPSIFGEKLSRLPGLAPLARFEGWHKLTIGHLFAVGLMAFVMIAWHYLARDYLLANGNRFRAGMWKLDNASFFLRAAGLLLLFCDVTLFYIGFLNVSSWSTVPKYFPGLVVTAMYQAGFMVFTFLSTHLCLSIRRVQ